MVTLLQGPQLYLMPKRFVPTSKMSAVFLSPESIFCKKENAIEYEQLLDNRNSLRVQTSLFYIT